MDSNSRVFKRNIITLTKKLSRQCTPIEGELTCMSNVLWLRVELLIWFPTIHLAIPCVSNIQ